MRRPSRASRLRAREQVWFVTALVGFFPLFAPTERPDDIILATTTSVRDAGLLDEILPPFERATGHQVRVVAVGSGQAMEMGKRGEADILILHEPAGEAAFVEAGYGIDRRPLMHNQFVLVGPSDDPAHARGTGAVEALRAIGGAGATFVSRGDRSGTHAREMALWQAAGRAPAPSWYRETGQGMGATLIIADELRAYTLTDIGTFLAYRAPLDLAIMVEGDILLRNSYHVIRSNPVMFPHVRAEAALALADYLVAESTQQMIGEFGAPEHGRPLFVPDALLPASR
ncbi:MAG TPA: substrate-binding domain-containing protein [Gemmatimonadales bacterium]